MRSIRVGTLVAIIITVLLSGHSPLQAFSAWHGASSVGSHPAGAAAMGSMPVVFEPNVGQTSSRVRYVAQTGGSALFLTDTEAVIATLQGDEGRLPKWYRRA
jgi:hypothetical protein